MQTAAQVIRKAGPQTTNEAVPTGFVSRLIPPPVRDGAMRSLIRLALAACLLPQVAPNTHAPSAVAPGQPPASRLASSKLARSLSEAGRRLQLRRLERTRGGEAQAEGGAEAEQQDGGVDAAQVESHAEVDRTRRGFYPRVYEAIADAESNGCRARGVLRVRVSVGLGGLGRAYPGR